jgi:hypothetical protein
MIKNSTNENWEPPEPPVDCYTLNYIGVYCIVLFVISFISNTTLLILIIKFSKELLKNNLLMMWLIILNLIGTLIEFPLVAISAFKCKYIIG